MNMELLNKIYGELTKEEVQKIKEKIIKSKTNYFRMPGYVGEMTMDEIDEEIKEYRKGN